MSYGSKYILLFIEYTKGKVQPYFTVFMEKKILPSIKIG